jgi:hypothetical protein
MTTATSNYPVYITIRTFQDGSTSIKIDGHYSHGKDPQFEGGHYRRGTVHVNATPRQIERLHNWMFAKDGRLGSYGGGWYTVYPGAK